MITEKELKETLEGSNTEIFKIHKNIIDLYLKGQTEDALVESGKLVGLLNFVLTANMLMNDY